MRVYTIFDDFSQSAIQLLREKGIALDVHPFGTPRPNEEEMKSILENYDCVIIGTSQKINADMFQNVAAPRMIATASVGLDHIKIPEEKKELVTILNTPKANAQSVAEYTIGAALRCCKRFAEAEDLYREERDNKALSKKPEDLFGKTMGVIGAGNVSVRIMELAECFGMHIVCWTAHPDRHGDLCDKGYRFMPLEELASSADVISVNLPNQEGTQDIISRDLIWSMKKECIFISVSRKETIDAEALIERADLEKNFYVNLDLDVDQEIVKMIRKKKNVFVTPHIAGGTIETRQRMFQELAEQIVNKSLDTIKG